MSELALVRFYQLVLSKELVLDDEAFQRREAEALATDIERAVAKALQEEIDRQLFAQPGEPVRIADTPTRPWLAIKVTGS